MCGSTVYIEVVTASATLLFVYHKVSATCNEAP